MLHSISWARFGAVLLVASVIYYGYVLVRFYGREVRALFGGGKAAGEEMAHEPAAGVGETPEMFKVMEKVIVLLRQVVNEAAATGVRREELEDGIRMLLSGYRQLVKTPYQVSINNFIQRSCTASFSLMLSDREIAALWGE